MIAVINSSTSAIFIIASTASMPRAIELVSTKPMHGLRLVRLFALIVAFRCRRKYKHAAALIATGTAICYLRPVNRHCLAQFFFYPGALMDKEEISRRMFLIRSCAGINAAWLAACWPEVL